jgi:hypothetical protein
MSPALAHKFLAHSAMGLILPLDSIDRLGIALPELHRLGKVSSHLQCSSNQQHSVEVGALLASPYIEGSTYQAGKLSKSSVPRLHTSQVHMERQFQLHMHALQDICQL